MKPHHFILLYMGFAIAVFSIRANRTDEIHAYVGEQSFIRSTIQQSADIAATALYPLLESNFNNTRSEAALRYMDTLYIAFDAISDPNKKALIDLFTPAIAIVENDGIYVLHNEYMDGEIRKVWSECIPFVYEDEYFVLRFFMDGSIMVFDRQGLLGMADREFKIGNRQAIEDQVFDLMREADPRCLLFDTEACERTRTACMVDETERQLSYYANYNNSIAANIGLDYRFCLPEIDSSEFVRALTNIGLIAIYQGYSLGGDRHFDIFAFAAAQVVPTQMYYIQATAEGSLYHAADCSDFSVDRDIQVYFSVYDCAANGAYACPKCHPEGVHR